MSDIWFKRKKYGWGWTPANLKGWLASLLYVVLAATITLLAPISMPAFLIGIFILTSSFIFICYKKGETPKWSWGPEKKDH